MPRQPRLDAPDTLHHIMGQGIDRIMKQPAEKGWLNEEVIGTSPAWNDSSNKPTKVRVQVDIFEASDTVGI